MRCGWGLVWKVREPSDLIDDARRHSEILASRPVSSLMAVRHTMVEPIHPAIAAASARENAHFTEPMGGAIRCGGVGGIHRPKRQLINRGRAGATPISLPLRAGFQPRRRCDDRSQCVSATAAVDARSAGRSNLFRRRRPAGNDVRNGLASGANT